MRRALFVIGALAGLASLPVSASGSGIALAGGANHTVALKADGTVWAWGDNTNGEIGDNTTTPRLTPVQVSGLTNVIAVAAGDHFSVALKQDGTVWAWGINTSGQLGDGTATQRLVPVKVNTLTLVSAISAGNSHCLAWKIDGTVWAWGLNSSGQLGDNSLTTRTSPVQVSGLTGTSGIAAGSTHSLARKTDGTVWAWGQNATGQLGDNSTTNRKVPVQVSGLTSVSAIAGGGSHSLALRTDGTVRSWGFNSNGQLGDNTTTDRHVPVTVTGLTGVADVTAGSAHSVALMSDGTARAWGWNQGGQLGDNTISQRRLTPVTVFNLANVIAVSAGFNHTVAIASGGVIWAWGTNASGQLGDGTTTQRNAPVQISASGFDWLTATPAFSPVPATYSPTATLAVTVTCATPGSTIRYTTNGVDPTPSDPVVVSGGTVTLSQTTTLKARAWSTTLAASNVAAGAYTFTVATPTFTPVGGTYPSAQSVTVTTATASASIYYTTDGSTPTTSSTPYTGAIVVGTTTTLTAKGFKTGWTSSANGVSTYTMSFGTLAAPTFAPAAGTYIDSQAVTISGPSGAALRYTTDGTNPTASSTLYTGPLTLTATTTLKAAAFKTDWTTSAVTTGTYTIQAATPTFTPDAGSYTSAQLITINSPTAGSSITYTTNGVDPTASDTTIPSGTVIQVGHSLTLKARAWKTGVGSSSVKAAAYVLTPSGLAGGRYHSAAVAPDGTVWTWGDNANGQLGDGTTTPRPTAVQVTGLTGVIGVASRGYHTLALKGDGTVWAWGLNTSGQLGDGTQAQKTTPVQVAGLTGVVAIAAGYTHSLALKGNGSVWAWGDNTLGQLGDNTHTMRLSPIQVSVIDSATAIAAGYSFSVALRTDGYAWAWGDNAQGQLGDGTTTQRTQPTQVLGINGIEAVAAGGSHTLALLVDGTVRAWGYNLHGSLGDGTTTTPRSSPVSVIGLTSVAAIAAGAEHSLAVKRDGTVWAWGLNGFSELGDGTTNNQSQPVQSGSLTGIVSVAAGEVHSLALASDGTVWAWGYNNAAQVGDGTTTPRSSPVRISGPSMAWSLPLPTLSPAGGTFSTPVSVLATTTVANTEIHYTLNGADPVLADPFVPTGGSILIDQPGTLRAKAFRTGWGPSEVATASYTFRVATPTLTPASGNYTGALPVTVATTSPGATLHYRLDGAEPTESDLVVASGASVNVDHSATLKVGGWRAGWTPSVIASATYWVALGNVAAPTFQPAPGTFTASQSVTVSSTTTGATIRYTLDGTEPTLTSPVYSVPLGLPHTAELRARAFKHDFSGSTTTVGLYVIDLGTVDAPRFTPAGGRYTARQAVTLTSQTPGAVIHYRTDGLIPDETDPVFSAGTPIVVDQYRHLTARAFKASVTPSAGVFADYEITGAVAVAGNHTVAVRADGTVWTWGTNCFGALGDPSVGAFGMRPLPAQVAGIADVTAVATGSCHTLALKSDGTVYAWGRNAMGELGNGSGSESDTPVQAAGLTDVVAIAAGDNFSLALKRDGSVWAWGGNSGSNANVDYGSIPVQVGGLRGVSAIAMGTEFVLAVQSDGDVGGTLWAWGHNLSGQIGDGTLTDRTSPIAVAQDVTSAAGASFHAYAVKTDGTVLAWGSNNQYPLGDGTQNPHYRPAPIPGLTDVVAVTTGSASGSAVKSDGTVVGWGSDDYGQIGDGTDGPPRPTPVSALVLSVVTLAGYGSSYHRAAVIGDGTLWTWGNNGGGALGDGTQGPGATPKPVPNFFLSSQAFWSLDSDGDGLTNAEELALGTSGRLADTNGDGIPDGAALKAGLSATNTDMDSDGVSNADEAARGTDPFRADTDGDGVNDAADCFPLDPARWQCPAADPNDHTPPVITLQEPTNATLISSVPPQ